MLNFIENISQLSPLWHKRAMRLFVSNRNTILRNWESKLNVLQQWRQYHSLELHQGWRRTDTIAPFGLCQKRVRFVWVCVKEMTSRKTMPILVISYLLANVSFRAFKIEKSIFCSRLRRTFVMIQILHTNVVALISSVNVIKLFLVEI